MVNAKLKNIAALKGTETASNRMFCGSDQDWYSREEQRERGCAPSTFASIYFYQCKKEDKDCCLNDKENIMHFMSDAWEFITPDFNGVPSISMFQEKAMDFAKAHGIEFQFQSLNVPAETSKRPSVKTLFLYLSQAISNDIPVAFLNLDSGTVKSLESWHWVMLSSISYEEETQLLNAVICDGGDEKEIDLSEWLRTSKSGGGFIYFTKNLFVDRIQKAKSNFMHGYNCGQAVACAFGDLVGKDETELWRMTSGCGRGMGTMEGTCGAVCGANLVANLAVTNNSLNKVKAFETGRNITEEFSKKNGSIICKELKGIGTGKVLRSCTGCVEDAASILQKFLLDYSEE